MIVKEINLPEIREAVKTVVNQESTPAYDLVGYFSQLDSGEQLREQDRRTLNRLGTAIDDQCAHDSVLVRGLPPVSPSSRWEAEKAHGDGDDGGVVVLALCLVGHTVAQDWCSYCQMEPNLLQVTIHHSMIHAMNQLIRLGGTKLIISRSRWSMSIA